MFSCQTLYSPKQTGQQISSKPVSLTWSSFSVVDCMSLKEGKAFLITHILCSHAIQLVAELPPGVFDKRLECILDLGLQCE